MKRATAEERALARASIYRLLALAFSYPTGESIQATREAADVATVAAPLADPETARRVSALAKAAATADRFDLEAVHRRTFTLSYSEDCPPYETAFSAKHLFQQTQHLADIAGFYRAFGVEPGTERPDQLALELEFCYLLALKEAWARGNGDTERVQLCRQAQRSFLREHLARWATLIGQRVAVAATGTLYEAAAWLLIAFVEFEERYLRLGAVARYRDEPVMIADDPGEMSCPLAEEAVTRMLAEPEREEHDALSTN